jgi:murein L,D-transpeptidase YcbB/YkuD
LANLIESSKYRTLTLLLVVLSTVTSGLYAEEPKATFDEESQEINRIIAARKHPYLIHADFTNRVDDLDALYKLGNYRTIWINQASNQNKVNEVVNLLENADEQGLVADSYDIAVLKQKLNAIKAGSSLSKQGAAQLDTAISLGLIRYLHDLHYGRVNPHGIQFNLQLREKKLIDIPKLIKDSLLLGTVAQLPLLTEPKLNQYQKLKSALAAYRELVKKRQAFKLIITDKLKPGDQHPQLAELSQFLADLGDIAESAVIPITEKKPRYTQELAEGIKKFQFRHGIAADGIIGQGTVEAINTPITQRIKQIELAMERMRWLPELTVGKSIIVNIPAFQLWAFDDVKNALPQITNMRVVVGKALKNQTPVLMAQMQFIEFLPYWNVPPNILKDEIIPKLIRNPRYLASQNMEIVAGYSQNAKSIPVSATAIDKLKKGIYRVRQRPGRGNSLGKVKFIFPNKDDVYLHDTPAGALFKKTRRDFSHGCVRVENPLALAEFVLKGQGNWNEVTIKKAMNRSDNQRVDLQHPIPVLFFYTTTFVDQNNNLAFYPDIYGHDITLLEALKKPNDLPDQSIFMSKEDNSFGTNKTQ